MMKNTKILFVQLLILILFFPSILLAQAPESMNYQAVIRNGSGDLVTSQQVGLRIKILQGSATGSSVYEETYSPTTNAYGLVNLQLGTGTVQSGTFSSIDWGNGPYFVETAADVSGGTSYVTLSTTQFMSVPYALYAKNAGLDSAAVQGIINGSISQGLTSCSGSQTFNFTGSTEMFILPSCVNEIFIECWGAEGQVNAGLGGYVSARYYPSNDTLYINVGGQNGYNGGGQGLTHDWTSSFGGGGSDVRTGISLSERIIVAGGGGSGYSQNNPWTNNSTGGDGGIEGDNWDNKGGEGGHAGNSLSGNTKGSCCGGSGSTNFAGSTQYPRHYAGAGGGGASSGGVSANYGSGTPTSDGSLGQGGVGMVGGGGGYYGGGGASAYATYTYFYAGGGGSSWAGGAEPPYSFRGGVRSGDGQVRITWK